jgi:hypothetical protein
MAVTGEMSQRGEALVHSNQRCGEVRIEPDPRWVATLPDCLSADRCERGQGFL